MKRRIDPDKLRAGLRGMRRDQLLLVAERAIELVPTTKLYRLVDDLLSLDEISLSGAKDQGAGGRSLGED